jgi:predicted ArsR family transcriptional regulator
MSPTRGRVLRFLEGASQPVGVVEIASALGLAQNSVRHHLSALEQAGRAESEVQRWGQRGRPRLVFRSRPAPEGPYERLALALMRARLTSESLEEAGAAVAPAGDDITAFLRAEGFDPHPEGAGTVLGKCPLAAAVAADPAAVCAVHRGLVTAIAARAGATVRLVPDAPGSCRILPGP